MSNKTTSTTIPSSGSGKVYSAQVDNVHVKSVVQTETQSMASIENTKKITNCMPHLDPTHLQSDEYSHKLIEEINEAGLEPIKIVVGETQLQQQQLLADANLQIQNDFKRKLPQHIAKLDSEKEFSIRHERFLKSAHKCFNDDLYEDNSLKLMNMDDYMADDIDIIAELDDGENYETIFVTIELAPTAELASAVSSAELAPAVSSAEIAPAVSSAELASAVSSAELAPAVSSAELAPAVPIAEFARVEPRCNRHYFTCGITGLLIGIVIMELVK
ncbi:unnamed protein product [Rotaria sordida]|uniref:Uncharacterized protein n=1 Tax=Rotaria sordida TaxID=392033 RepID=A0A815J828_9BILA|nr:unnamed protein product [Rotaria sordida]